MKVFVVYAHPSCNSFTYQVKERFLAGLVDAGHTYEISDLYAMNFKETFTEQEYMREAFYQEDLPVPEDVLVEQRKCVEADAIAFIYPVFWTEAPAKLVGWFQRVFTYGFAYGEEPALLPFQKAIFLVTMGGSLKDPIRQKEVEAMETVMLLDRINTRAKEKRMIVFDEMTRGNDVENFREENQDRFLIQSYELGRNISSIKEKNYTKSQE